MLLIRVPPLLASAARHPKAFVGHDAFRGRGKSENGEGGKTLHAASCGLI